MGEEKLMLLKLYMHIVIYLPTSVANLMEVMNKSWLCKPFVTWDIKRIRSFGDQSWTTFSSLDCFNFGKNQFSPIVCQQPLGSKYFQNSSSLWFCSSWKQWAYYWNQLAEFSFNLNHLAFPDTTVSILSGLHAQGNEVSLTHYTVI